MKQWDQAVIDALRSGNPTVATLYEIQARQGAVRMTDAAHDLDYQGATYVSAGQVLGRDDISTRKALEVQSINLTFTLVEQGIWAIFANESQLGRRVIITEVALDDRHRVIGETIRTINRVNSVSVDDDEDSATVSVEVSNLMADFQAVRGIRTTQASHQLMYPSSTSFINAKGFSEVEWRG